jgi:hypothetical protein
LQSRWGKLFRDPKFVLESLSAIPPLHVLRERNSKWLFQNSRMSLSEEEWHKRLSWSYFAEIYLRDLLWYSARARRSGRVSEVDTRIGRPSQSVSRILVFQTVPPPDFLHSGHATKFYAVLIGP